MHLACASKVTAFRLWKNNHSNSVGDATFMGEGSTFFDKLKDLIQISYKRILAKSFVFLLFRKIHLLTYNFAVGRLTHF